VERRFTLPLQALEAMELDGSGTATMMLLNPTGGVVGGDVLETSIALGPGSCVCLTTPAATRVYRSAGAPAVQRVRARVGAGARLEYVPDHLIPSPGARLRQSADITLEPGASLLLVDSWAVGRIARNEQWCFDELDMSLAVSDTDGLLLKERCVLDRVRRDGLGLAQGLPYVATFVVVDSAVATGDDIARELLASLEALGCGALFGVTTLARGGILARLLCPSAPVLDTCVRTLWVSCRRRLFGLAPLSLRKL
jgi:urease accessory protein